MKKAQGEENDFSFEDKREEKEEGEGSSKDLDYVCKKHINT